MTKEITKDEFWNLFERLPQDLKETIFSGETAEHVRNICERYEVKEELIPKVAKIIGDVLLGLLPLENLSEELGNILKLEKSVIEKINREVNRFIFFPVKARLKELYGKEEVEEEGEEIEERIKKEVSIKGQDKYRELAE